MPKKKKRGPHPKQQIQSQVELRKIAGQFLFYGYRSFECAGCAYDVWDLGRNVWPLICKKIGGRI